MFKNNISSIYLSSYVSLSYKTAYSLQVSKENVSYTKKISIKFQKEVDWQMTNLPFAITTKVVPNLNNQNFKKNVRHFKLCV